MKIRIAPSILTADFGRLAEQVVLLEKGGADALHLDIMDGHFVPNLTFGPAVASSLRKITSLPFDVHLMTEHPEKFLEAFTVAGGTSFTVHAEACPHLHRVIQLIKKMGLQAGVALNPATPLQNLDYVLEDLDQVLLMTVNPGWGGQEFIRGMYAKLRKLRNRITKKGYSLSIQVDGGINFSTAAAAVKAGADSLVIGSALLKESDPLTALGRYRMLAEEALLNSFWGKGS